MIPALPEVEAYAARILAEIDRYTKECMDMLARHGAKVLL